MSWYKISQTGISVWLDDNRDPSDPKIQSLFGAKGDEVWAKTADEAIHYLKQGNVKFISFDHDLDNRGLLPGEKEKNGALVARWIEEQAFYGNIDPIGWNVHSRNNVGSQEIVSAMTKAEEFWGTDDVSTI